MAHSLPQYASRDARSGDSAPVEQRAILRSRRAPAWVAPAISRLRSSAAPGLARIISSAPGGPCGIVLELRAVKPRWARPPSRGRRGTAQRKNPSVPGIITSAAPDKQRSRLQRQHLLGACGTARHCPSLPSTRPSRLRIASPRVVVVDREYTGNRSLASVSHASAALRHRHVRLQVVRSCSPPLRPRFSNWFHRGRQRHRQHDRRDNRARTSDGVRRDQNLDRLRSHARSDGRLKSKGARPMRGSRAEQAFQTCPCRPSQMLNAPLNVPGDQTVCSIIPSASAPPVKTARRSTSGGAGDRNAPARRASLG